MTEQTPSAGRIVYYRSDGTPSRVVEDDDIVGVFVLGAAVIDLADGAAAYDEGNMYKGLFHHRPEGT